jgi:ATP-binding protein involved in chromosome partitioning
MPPSPSVDHAQVLEALRRVEEPLLDRDVVDLGLVESSSVDDGTVRVTLAEPTDEYPFRPELIARATEALSGLDGVGSVRVDTIVLDADGQAALRRHLIGEPEKTVGSQPSQGHAEGRAIPFAEPGSTTRVLLIASGKGGVGKSSVTANLAVALAQRGRRTAVVDADVWGFSIPRMLGVPRPPVLIDRMLVPPEAYGVRCISMGFFAEEDTPVIWRGPMLHKALEQFLTDVWWGEPDFLVVDLPPGTGDISISMAQFLPRSEVFIVTTPQAAAQRVAQRAAFMAEKVQLDVRGVIENMSWFTGDDGTRYELFGAGGGQELADRLDVPLVGQVPLVPLLREGSDSGRPIVAVDPDGEAAGIFRAIAERIDVELAPTKRYHPELKVL